jgi:hypothetical protein
MIEGWDGFGLEAEAVQIGKIKGGQSQMDGRRGPDCRLKEIDLDILVSCWL